MAKLVTLTTKSDDRGNLTVIEKEIPFSIKRIFYIYNLTVGGTRGGHRHHKTIQALICLNGKCSVFVNNGKEKSEFILNRPDQLLILNPEDWHTMHSFSENTILLVVASEEYDPNDYIYEEYP